MRVKVVWAVGLPHVRRNRCILGNLGLFRFLGAESEIKLELVTIPYDGVNNFF